MSRGEHCRVALSDVECSDRCFKCGRPFAQLDEITVTAAGVWLKGKMQRLHSVHLVHKYCPASIRR